jgi:protein involved in polysaccharide export with SLBB domain
MDGYKLSGFWMNLMRDFFCLSIVLFFTSINIFSFAADLTPTQIAQMKQLSKTQQEALARQYGVDLSDLKDSKEPKKRHSVQTISERPEEQELYDFHTDESLQTDNYLQAIKTEKEINASKPLIDFGYDLFAGQPSSYTPLDDLPVPNSYLIAPGDEIVVQVYGSQNDNYHLTVSRDGSIQFPELGPVHVAGQTMGELKANLTKRIEKQILGGQVAISLGALRMMQIYVTGDVYRPGAYNIPSLAPVTQALIAAGGFSRSGSLRDITIRRNNKVVDHLDLYGLLLRGDKKHDIRLQSGDTVFVAPKGATVSIRGQIHRPAYYEIRPGTTLFRLIQIAGGSKANAYIQQIQIKRYQSNGIHVYTLDLTKTADKQFILQDGDDVNLYPISDTMKNAVMVRGAVVRQGVYAYHHGMTVGDLFTSSTDDLMPNADFDYALVVREINDKHDIKVLQFSVGQAINHPGTVTDLVLKPNDQIIIFATDLSLSAWQPPAIRSVTQQINESRSLAQVKSNQESRRDALTGVRLVSDNSPKLTTSNSETDNQEQQRQEPYSRIHLLEPVIDRLKQQAVNEQKVKIFEVSGSVRYPGIYPLVEGGKLKDAITAAGGLLESATKDQAELSRVVIMPSSVSLYHRQFDLEDALTKPKDNFLLESKDRIVIQRKTNWTAENVVEILGEVRHPGSYTINQGETIADLVKRAGGLTQYAYPQGSVFSREILREQEKQRMKMVTNSLRQEIASLALRRQSNSASYPTSPVDALKVVDDLTTLPAVGRLVINLPHILRGDKQANVLLESGDKLYIPPKRNTISVLGQVQMASNFTYEPDISIGGYIDMAGGEKKQADTERIYVIRANGSVMLPNKSRWFTRSSRPLKPGDTIVVPINTDYLDGLSTFSTATQIMYQIGVAWNAIK